MPADEISQVERRMVLANDRKVLATYHGVAQTSVDDDRGGRFAVGSPTTVVGTSPINYPRQPESSPANQAALVGDEPPLGFSVNDMEPVGEIHERNERDEQRAASKWRRL